MTLRGTLLGALCAIALAAGSIPARAESALSVLGTDFTFPNRIEGLPGKLSDFPQLQINAFVTGDGVRLTYWEAGSGPPLIFVPGWSGNGAQYVNLIFMLSQHYHVYVLDPRNQGLSQHVDHGGRIARMSMDLKEFGDHLGIRSADYVGHSMGSAILWSYIDLFGTGAIRRVVFVDEPVSIYSHQNWSEAERLEAGGTTTAPERTVEAFTAGGPVNRLVTDMKPFERAQLMDSPYFANSESFASAVIRSDPKAMGRVLFNHVVSDWRDVIRAKVDVPAAIFSGEESNNLPSQRWMASVIPHAQLFVYSEAEQGDHFLMFKNPVRFTSDLRSFLDR
jgi:pimeloyl-ACP methyl ester carboxylesterase